MKIRWNKINRGLVLGALLLVGLVGFILFKNAQFQKEIPEIREGVKAYTDALLALNMSPEGTEIGEPLTDAQKTQKMDQFDAMIAKYWASESSDHYMNAEQIRENYEDSLKFPQTVNMFHYDWEVLDKRITVTEDGPDYATVRMSIEGVTIESQGCADSIFTTEHTKYGMEIVYKPEGSVAGDVIVDGADAPEYDTGFYRCVYNGNLQFSMKREDGEWKITGMAGMLWLRSMTEIEEVSGS